MRLKLTNLPDDVVKFYKIAAKVTKDGYVYVKTQQGMYGLPQAGMIAQHLLKQRLNKEGYYQGKCTRGLWTHKWRHIAFSFCVNNIGVKYVGKAHSDHLMSVLQAHNKISSDCSEKNYLGLDHDWEYA